MQTATLTELTKRSFFEMMKDVATSIPGHVLAFDPATQLAQIQIGIVRKDVKGKEFTPPPLIEVPVHFAGGKFTVEYQIDAGDEGFILFSQRCIDGWITTGGVAKNPILRFHDMSDAVFFPGVRSQPNAITDFANNGVRLRNEAGDQYFWLKNDESVHVANAAGSYVLDAGGAFTGTFTDFNINSNTFTHNGTNVGETHKHAAGTYNIGGTPVVDNSGDPI